MNEESVVMYDGFYPIFTTVPTTPATEEFKFMCVQNHIGATVMDLYHHYYCDEKPLLDIVTEFLSSETYRQMYNFGEGYWRDTFAITRDKFLMESNYPVKKIPTEAYGGNIMDRPKLGAVILASDCLYAYSNYVLTPLKECARLFVKYGIFSYILEAYEKLSEVSMEKIITKVIARKIKEGVIFLEV